MVCLHQGHFSKLITIAKTSLEEIQKSQGRQLTWLMPQIRLPKNQNPTEAKRLNLWLGYLEDSKCAQNRCMQTSGLALWGSSFHSRDPPTHQGGYFWTRNHRSSASALLSTKGFFFRRAGPGGPGCATLPQEYLMCGTDPGFPRCIPSAGTVESSAPRWLNRWCGERAHGLQ